jgi:hypothetical protein
VTLSYHPHPDADSMIFYHICSVTTFPFTAYRCQNYEGSWMLPCLEANKLACQSFIDAGRSQETFGSVTKTSLLMTWQAVLSACSHWFLYFFNDVDVWKSSSIELFTHTGYLSESNTSKFRKASVV